MKTYSLSWNKDVLTGLCVNTLFVALATAAVILRIIARRLRKVSLWIDDYTIIASLFVVYILFAIQIADAKLGMRVQITVIPLENLTMLLKLLVPYQLFYGTSLLLGKASYLFFYRRIFVVKSFMLATWIILGVVICWYIANILQVFLICRPFKSNYDVAVTAVCGNRPAAYTAIGAINMVTDIIIMILPIPYVRQLQMPTSSKVGICVIFLIGLLICAISIVRMQVLSKLDFEDISYDMLNAVFWTVTEPSLVIINACIPTMRHLIKFILPNRSWNGSKSKKYPTDGGSSRQFQRMNDEYPLTHPKGIKHTVQIRSTERDLESMSNVDDTSDHDITSTSFVREQHNALGSHDGGVEVRKEWTITSKRA